MLMPEINESWFNPRYVAGVKDCIVRKKAIAKVVDRTHFADTKNLTLNKKKHVISSHDYHNACSDTLVES
jgi:hypothetical protein